MSKKPEAIILFADSARGIYIPQFFAETVRRDMLHTTCAVTDNIVYGLPLFSGVSADDLEILEAGPEHEWYWETWESVLNNAEIRDGEHVYWLYQDGDLFAICDELMTAAEYREFFGCETDTYLETWFERDRAHVELKDSRNDKTIIEWWDEAVQEAVTAGFLDPRDWHGSAIEYAREHDLI